ncbi:MAG: acylneuraminate cytidylyltransferase family protein [candidate division Zixibacteria bacterium]|nr:acylneuraminate cytidylyltransferase family protein [candidate division Zixibacteria bacterium]
MVKKSVIAVIPARGGSRRIPGKNLVEFAGRPLIAWTIEAALEAGLFERVLVSTDDERIAAAATAAGLEVPFLRDRCADDHATASEATITALAQAEKILDEQYETVVQLLPTCPLRNGRHINEAYDSFVRAGAPFQISCFRYGWMNPWWAVKLDDNMSPIPVFPEVKEKRSQDLPKLYCPTGAVWIARVAALQKAGSFYGPGHTFYPMDWKASVDIDERADLEMAQALHSLVSMR